MAVAVTAEVRFSPHAARQCASRDFPLDAVREVIAWKLERVSHARHVAVHVGRVAEERGALIGSNGSEVWAIVRDGVVVTVMLRRAGQPVNAAAFDVEEVAA